MKIKSGGININCEVSGPEGAPVLLLSHSLASSGIMWKPQVELLSQQFRVLRIDTRGHGESDAPAGAYTLDELGDDFMAVLTAMEIEKATWIGLSMGGMIGQNFALRYPDRLEKLVLCDTAAVIPEAAQPVWEERIATVGERGLGAVVDETMERWFTPAYLEKNPPLVAVIRRQILETPVTGFIGCSQAIRRINYLDKLSGIRLSTLVIVGEDDPGTPVSAAEAMHAKISGSKLVVLPDARHLSNIEQADGFNKAIIEFLH